MKAFELSDLTAARQAAHKPYLEFLREPSLSVGLYVLPVGGIDKQQPHTEDEIYYVISGRGSITLADEERPVQPGSVIFVAAHVEHRFHTITEALTLLVFFAPAEGAGQ